MTTDKVRRLFLAGKNEAGHAEVVSQKQSLTGCDTNVRVRHETHRPGRIEFAAPSSRVIYCGANGGKGRAGQHGVGSAVKGLIIGNAAWTRALISERPMSLTFNFAGYRLIVINFVVAPRDTV